MGDVTDNDDDGMIIEDDIWNDVNDDDEEDEEDLDDFRGWLRPLRPGVQWPPPNAGDGSGLSSTDTGPAPVT